MKDSRRKAIFRTWGGVLLAMACAGSAYAQLGVFSKEQRIEFTRDWKGERFPDGRPKVPDSVLERMKHVSAEEAWSVLSKAGFKDHFEDGWMHFANGTKERLVGRVVTALFLPIRPDVDAVIRDRGKVEKRSGSGENSWVIDTLVPGDVLVVDEFEKFNFMGDNLATSVFAKSKNGIVVNGSSRDLTGISEIEGFQGYMRGWNPSSVTHGIRNVMLMGVNVPIRIGNTTVMPGDVVLGDPEGLMFIPAQLAEKVVDHADDVHLRDEWSHSMLREGRYTPGQLDTSTWPPEIEADFQKWVAKEKKQE